MYLTIRLLGFSMALLMLASGCATGAQSGPVADVAKAKQSLASFTQVDLQAAIAAAGKATDAEAPYRARCYTTLLKHVPDGQTVGQALPSIKGAVSAFEAAAELDAKVRSGAGGSIVPADVHADCAVIVTSLEQFLIRIDALAAGAAVGAPGAAGALGAIPGLLHGVPLP